MRLRYHIQFRWDGWIVLEDNPHFRTVPIIKNSQQFAKLPFPYTYLLIHYIKRNNGFVYPGIYDFGLNVVGSAKRLNSFSDEGAFVIPDLHPVCGICTDHLEDGKKFSSLKEFSNFVYNFYYSSPVASDSSRQGLTCEQFASSFEVSTFRELLQTSIRFWFPTIRYYASPFDYHKHFTDLIMSRNINFNYDEDWKNVPDNFDGFLGQS
jgi:hypothetical protein